LYRADDPLRKLKEGLPMGGKRASQPLMRQRFVCPKTHRGVAITEKSQDRSGGIGTSPVKWYGTKKNGLALKS